MSVLYHTSVIAKFCRRSSIEKVTSDKNSFTIEITGSFARMTSTVSFAQGQHVFAKSLITRILRPSVFVTTSVTYIMSNTSRSKKFDEWCILYRRAATISLQLAAE